MSNFLYMFECHDHGPIPHQWCRTCEIVTQHRRSSGLDVYPLVTGEICKTTFGRRDACSCSDCRDSI